MTDDEIARLGVLVLEVDRPVQPPLPRYATGIMPPGLTEEEALRRALEDSATQPSIPRASSLMAAKRPRPITILIFAFLLFLHTTDAGFAVEGDDRSVLLVFKAGVSGDPNGALAGWGSPDVCNWTGVACDAVKLRVVKLILSEQNLSGEVSPVLGNLSQLRTLDISSNQFAGGVPPELGNLSCLKFLSISSNKLNGTVPPKLGNLSRLKILDMSANMLTQTVPPDIGNLSRLRILDLSGNLFAGAVPPQLGKLTLLEELSLSGNQLEGSIPAELRHIRSLIYLNLGGNYLSGHIPAAIFCNLSALQYFDVSYNSLDGKIPIRADCPLPDLEFFVLWTNNLRGGIPRSLSNSTKLRWLLLEDNFLAGELPSEHIFGGMRSLKYLYLSYNFFTSPSNNTNLEVFFASLTNCTSLTRLAVAGNDLAGTI
ncbi:hypothetical protein ACQ4PT_040541 [Festuca glaucescens]